MIISHEHRFIFLKTTKTAGTSMEIALSRVLGPRDVITPVSPDDEALRAAAGGRPPQHYDRALRPWELRPKPVGKWLLGRGALRRPLYWNHMTAAEVRNRVGEPVWRDYFTFCFVRNPWDRAVSQHFYRRKRLPRESLARSLEVMDLAVNESICCIDGAVAVDFVGRYENLAEDFAEACRRIGLPDLGPLPRAKTGLRTDPRSYREVLDAAQAQLVATACQQEIRLFGYAF